MIRKDLAVMGAGALLAALALSACGNSPAAPSAALAKDWSGILQAADQEGGVTIYSTHSPANLEKLKKAFEAKYPKIKLTYVRGTDADILPKVEVENQTGNATVDVHMTTDAGWIDRTLKTGTMSVKVVGPDFDNPAYKRAESMIDNTWFLTSATVFGMGWNTDKLPKGLTTVQHVLDPALKGKVAITNPSGIPTYIDMYRRIDRDWGSDFLPRLAQNQPRIYQSAVAIGQALASGEVWASPTTATTVLPEMAKGAPIGFALPEKPFGVPWYSQVLAKAPHPNAAQVLADFLVTPEGQAAISANYISVLPDIKGTGVPGSNVLAQEIKLPDPNSLDPESVKKDQQKWEGMFLQ
jgi:iron(III) transport system substrate-binding protein